MTGRAVDQPDVFLTASFLHDVVVMEIEGRWIMLLSYWDGGWVLLDVTDPANPEFIGDTDDDAIDPLLLEELGVTVPPELASQFDAWGYVHLIDAATLEDLDQFAVPEALDPSFAEGFGDLSVHEVAVDPQDASLAYLSYYAGGLVTVQIQRPAGTPYDPDSPPADTSTCELIEVGSYLDPEGKQLLGRRDVRRRRSGKSVLQAYGHPGERPRFGSLDLRRPVSPSQLNQWRRPSGAAFAHHDSACLRFDHAAATCPPTT